MNERITLRRTRNRRRSSGGYSLIELMVVVVLIAILAGLAAPSFVTARGDRLAFTYARTVAELVHNARARSEARGSAHLVVFTTNAAYASTRGATLVFEALDGPSPAPPAPAGPNPVPSCKTPNQWVDVTTWTPGAAASNKALLIDGLNINDNATGAVEVGEHITMTAQLTITNPPAVKTVADSTTTGSFVLCTTPNGTTYFGYGTSIDDAINNPTTGMMASTTTFTDFVEIDVARHVGADNGPIAGLNRRVLITGGAAPRINSK